MYYLKNFIATAVAFDKRAINTRWKLKNGPIVKSVILNIRHNGISFDVWAKRDEYFKKETILRKNKNICSIFIKQKFYYATLPKE